MYSLCIHWRNVFYLQINLETRGTENHGVRHSGATDVPVAEKEGSTDNKELNNGETCN
jgi:hypothetical protein